MTWCYIGQNLVKILDLLFDIEATLVSWSRSSIRSSRCINIMIIIYMNLSKELPTTCPENSQALKSHMMDFQRDGLSRKKEKKTNTKTMATKQSLSDEIFSVLDSIDRPGDFATGGALSGGFVLPGIRLIKRQQQQQQEQEQDQQQQQQEQEEEEYLSLPLTEHLAKRVIEKYASKCPFGRGTETLYDDQVRQCYQLDPSQFRITNPQWDALLQNLLENQIQKDLGIDTNSVSIGSSLYKMLLYEPGGHFDRHRDTEKEERMFGTLIIQLPCEYQGGALTVSHAHREKTFDFSRHAPIQCFFAAFYADCVHQLQAVTSGYRLCLVYNLIFEPKRQSSSASADQFVPRPVSTQTQVDRLKNLVESWVQDVEEEDDDETPTKLLYMLDHKYTEFNLSFQHLKNKDAAVAQVLRQLNQQMDAIGGGLELRLGMLTKHESGGAEVGWGRSAEMIEVYELTYTVEHWVDPLGNRDTLPMIEDLVPSSEPSSFDFEEFDPSKLSIDEEEIIPGDSVENMPLDDEELQEATGNEGATLDRWYRNTVILFWPKRLTFDMLLNADLSATVQIMESNVNQLQTHKESETVENYQRLKERCRERLQTMIHYIDHYQCRMVVTVLRIILEFGDDDLLQQHIRRTVMKNLDGIMREKGTGTLLFEIFSKSEWRSTMEPVMTELLTKLGTVRSIPETVVPLLTEISKCAESSKDEESRNVALQMCETLFQHYDQHLEKKTKQPPSTSTSSFRRFGGYSSYLYSSSSSYGARSDVEVTRTVIRDLIRIDQMENVKRVVERLKSNTKVFDTLDYLTPLLKGVASGVNLREGKQHALRELLDFTIQTLKKETEGTIQAPSDWRVNAKLKCACNWCKRIQTFMDSRTDQVAEIPAAKQHRQHMHNAIDAVTREIDHTTRRVGSPFTLVLTKVRRGYSDKLDLQNKKLQALRELEALRGGASGSSGQPPRKKSRTEGPQPIIID